MLHWLAGARPARPAGHRATAAAGRPRVRRWLLAPHVAGLGHRHVGVDLAPTASPLAREHGVAPVRGAARLPLADGVADVVVAGEILEHVADVAAVVAECVRLLRPGGTLVIDAIASTWSGRFSSITIGERVPGGPPPRLHDPALFVDRAELAASPRRAGWRCGWSGCGPPPATTSPG